ncbi:MAG TPA: helix-turn-helix domain-containing protein [Thermomicrobiales bacterium]|nr:helix-turn-helix domain-containing protein [Thermomicrobiales bacterium]
MSALTKADLERVGLDVSPQELERLFARAVRALPPAPRAASPERDLSAADRAELQDAGFSFAPPPAGSVDPLAETVAEYGALLATALTVAEAARRLGVDESRVRQLLARRALYGIKQRGEWRLPRFQFDPARPGGLVPGVDRVLPRLDRGLHLVGVYRWFTNPDPDLVLGDTAVSPLDWLRTGGDPEPVADLAAAL